MKINPNELTTNKYKAVKSSDIDTTKKSYQANTFKQDKLNKTLNKSKLRIVKKSEKVEVVVEPIIKKAELREVSEFAQTLTDILK